MGLAAGVFSGLLGVGGGILIIPPLIAFLAYPPKTAMATSLGAIVFTSLAAAVSHASAGNVVWGDAILIGIPAAFGAVGGAWLQQRVDSQKLVLAFSAFLVVVAIRLAV